MRHLYIQDVAGDGESGDLRRDGGCRRNGNAEVSALVTLEGGSGMVRAAQSLDGDDDLAGRTHQDPGPLPLAVLPGLGGIELPTDTIAVPGGTIDLLETIGGRPSRESMWLPILMLEKPGPDRERVQCAILHNR